MPLRNAALWGAVVLSAGLAIAIAGFEGTGLDLWVQDHCYDFDKQAWLVSKDATLPSMIFYVVPKGAFIVLGLVVLAVMVKPLVTRSGRVDRRMVVVFLSLVSVPAAVGILKDATDVYFPSQIERYGGKEPYAKLFEEHPEVRKRTKLKRKPGHGFPAGHASGGFALMGLCVLGRTRRERLAYIAFGMAMGWTLGTYQMLNGNHYLSHTVVTNFLAGILVLLWVAVFLREPAVEG